jgi:polygalacturonase
MVQGREHLEVMAVQYYMKSFGGNGDALYDNSTSFALAFAALHSGDSLSITEGIWRTGPLTIQDKNNITLRLEKGARILFSDDENKYEPVFSRWEGVNCYCLQSCLSIVSSSHIRITGEGTLDGQGKAWWEASSYKREFQKGPVSPVEKRLSLLNPGYEGQSGGGGGRLSQYLRPPLLQIIRSEQVCVEGITLTNSPFWTLHSLYSNNLLFKDLSIINPKDAPNTDGIDIDSCQNVQIQGCKIDVGDDGIALKSGSGEDGIRTNIPTNNVRIEHCTVKNAHGGAVIGSETAGGIFDVKVSDCLFDGTDRGVRIKTRRGRGGKITNLVFSDIRMQANLCPLTLNMYYRCGSDTDEDFSLMKQMVSSTTPSLSDITIRNCTATGSRSSAGFIVGLPEEPITGLHIENCSFGVASKSLEPVQDSEMTQGLPEVSERGIRMRNVHCTLQGVEVTGTGQPLVIEEGVIVCEL